MIKNLFVIIFVSFFLCKASIAKSINERLDDIEKRLNILEKNSKELSIFDNLINNTNKRDIQKNKVNKSKVYFTLKKLECVKDNFSEKIRIIYWLKNNYDKKIKLVDGYFEVKDLFGDHIYSSQFLKNADIAPNYEKGFVAKSIGFVSDTDCAKLSSVDFKDYKITYNIEKIAFEDNSILQFNDR